MKIHSKRQRFAYLPGGLGGDPSLPDGSTPAPDCCDVGTVPPDRGSNAQGARTVVLSVAGPPVLIQSKTAYGTVTLDATPTAGNLLVAWMVARSAATNILTSGWTVIDATINNIGAPFFIRYGAMAYKVSDGADGTINTGPGSASAAQIVLMEWQGSYAGDFVSADNVASTTNLDCGGSIAAPDGSVVLGGATLGNDDDDYPGLAVSPDTDVVEVFDSVATASFSPGAWVGYIDVETAGTFTVGGTISASVVYSGATIVIEGTGVPTWNVPAPEVGDGDDETYEEIRMREWMPVTRGEMTETPEGRVFTVKDHPHDYMEVPPERVSLPERRAASAALAFGARDLGLGPIHVHWFLPHAGDAPVAFRAGSLGVYIGGRTRAGRNRCIWVCAGRSAADIPRVVLHELRHLRYSMDHKLMPGHRYTLEERAETERLAAEYADEHKAATDAMGQPDWPSRAYNRRIRRRAIA